MATLEQIEAALRAADAAAAEGRPGAADDARRLAQAYQQTKAAQPVDKPADPTEGMSALEKGVVGFGKAFVDTARGLGQHARGALPQSVADRLGLPTAADIEEARRLDAPLMKHGAAVAGNMLGTASTLAPLAAVPGANTYAGAASIGALGGALQPFTSEQEFGQNVLTGGAGGAGGLAAGRGIGAAYQQGKALLSPFFRKGQEAIVRDTLHAFAADPARAAAQLRATPRSTIPGATQTAAEAARDRGLAQLERSILNNPNHSQRLAQMRGDSQVARVQALQDIAGDEGQMAFFRNMRTELSREMYEPLLQSPIDKKAITPWVKGEITSLRKNPVVQEASKVAEKWIQTEGRNLNEKSMLRGLHYTKQAIDDMIEGAKPQEAMRLKGVKTRITGLLDRLTDGNYSGVSAQYSELSKPINQMQIGQTLLNRAQPNQYLRGTEVGVRPDAFSRAMSMPDRTAAAATGYGKARMADIMSPEQMATLDEVGRQFAGRAFAEGAGRAAGSNTAQNLISQNVLRQTLGPLGLPQTWSEAAARSALGQTLLRPAQFVGRIGEDRVMPMLADVLADPVRAADMLVQANRRTIGQQFGNAIDPFLPMVGISYALPANR